MGVQVPPCAPDFKALTSRNAAVKIKIVSTLSERCLMKVPRAISVQYRNQFFLSLALIVYKGAGVGAGGSKLPVLGKYL